MFSDFRQPLPEINSEVLDSSLGYIDKYFGLNWLCQSTGQNPIQLLWNREDFVATEELYILGKSLELHECINQRWLEDQVAKAKSNELNTHKGAIFEIMGLSIFSKDDIKIEPSPENNPGVDAVLQYNKSLSINLSIKNFGVSKANQNFAKNSEDFELWLIDVLKRTHNSGLQFVIRRRSPSLEQNDWESLKKIVEKKLIDGDLPEDLLGWELGINILTEPNISKNPDFVSYTLEIISPFDKNENKNFLSKVEDGCSNISKHKKEENSTSINVILVHVPESIKIDVCVEWSDLYFGMYDDKPVSGIVFYQPEIVNSQVGLYVGHNIKVYLRKEHLEKIGIVEIPDLSFNISSGLIEKDIAFSNLIENEETDDVFESIGLYRFKSGQIFVTSIVYGNQDDYIHISLEDGVAVSLVIGEYTLSLIGPKSLKLSIL